MLLYVLDIRTFDRIAVIEEYESCIWTERFIEPGDVTLVVAERSVNSELLRPGILLENEDSNVPMLIVSAELQGGMITITGTTVEVFFNQRSVPPKTYTDSPGRIMGAVIDDMQQEYLTSYGIPGVRSGLILADGDDVVVKISKREKVYDLLFRLAKQYAVDMYVRRNFNADTNAYDLVVSTRLGDDHTEGNLAGRATVRFSQEDENLIGIHEMYTANNQTEMVVVHVPSRFAAPGKFGNSLSPVIINADGYVEYASVNGFNYPSFNTRITEPDSEELTNKYLSERAHIYYPGAKPSDWYEYFSDNGKRNVLKGEMVRMGLAAYNSSKSKPTHVIDGEVVANTFRFGTDYRLGDLVEITTALDDFYPVVRRTAMVSEYIRTSDSSGSRAYPTLAEPVVPAPYDDSPKDHSPDTAIRSDHTFSINGRLPDDLEELSPHTVRVRSDKTKKIVSLNQIGPRRGTCTLRFKVNNTYVTDSDLPYDLEDYDDITVDPSIHNSTAAYVSGSFTIETDIK